MLLEMAAEGCPERVALGKLADGLTYEELLARARSLGAELAASKAKHVAMVDTNSEAVPLLVYAASFAGVPFVPLNYRLADPQLRAASSGSRPPCVVAPPEQASRFEGVDRVDVWSPDALGTIGTAPDQAEAAAEDDAIAILLFTSGTSGEPKARGAAPPATWSPTCSRPWSSSAPTPDEAILVSVPPYHIAGISAIAHLGLRGAPDRAAAGVQSRGLGRASPGPKPITHAMVVPTMLGRILDVRRGATAQALPALRHLSYGGGRMPVPVVERALRLLPDVDFVNAYGLTETSSTIAVLGPDDHREARRRATIPGSARRLGSVGRPLPSRRDRDPRPGRRGRGRRRARARSTSAASRCRASTSAQHALDGGRLVPHARRADWLDADGLPLRRGPGSTTSSCAAARTCRRARSRTCCSTTPAVAEAAVSACPTPSGASASSPPWCCDRVPTRPRTSCRTGCARSCGPPRPRRGSQFRRRAPAQRDRQASPPRAPRGAVCRMSVMSGATAPDSGRGPGRVPHVRHALPRREVRRVRGAPADGGRTRVRPRRSGSRHPSSSGSRGWTSRRSTTAAGPASARWPS